MTNSRLAYLSNTEGLQASLIADGAPAQNQSKGSKSNLVTLSAVRSEEGQVFERLSKQAQIYQNLKKEKKEL